MKTGLAPGRVLELTKLMTKIPDGFNIHPKVKKLYEQRVEMAEDKRLFDYGAAELLAYASLLTEGTPVRLTGQDSQRGTFNQRHAVTVDMETEVRYTPLDHLNETQARFEVHNSLLSEAAALGYEYGYSRDMPEALVLWEAQFGRLCKRRADHHRPVHRGGRGQVGPAVRRGNATAARL